MSLNFFLPCFVVVCLPRLVSNCVVADTTLTYCCCCCCCCSGPTNIQLIRSRNQVQRALTRTRGGHRPRTQMAGQGLQQQPVTLPLRSGARKRPTKVPPNALATSLTTRSEPRARPATMQQHRPRRGSTDRRNRKLKEERRKSVLFDQRVELSHSRKRC